MARNFAKMAIAGFGVVVLSFWVTLEAIDYLERPSVGRVVDAVSDLAMQRSKLLSMSSANIDVGAMRKSGVKVPEGLLREERLASPWGQVAITKVGNILTLDFYEIPVDACSSLLTGASRIPGVVRVAATGSLADEQRVPVSKEQADKECNRKQRLVRIVISEQ